MKPKRLKMVAKLQSFGSFGTRGTDRTSGYRHSGACLMSTSVNSFRAAVHSRNRTLSVRGRNGPHRGKPYGTRP